MENIYGILTNYLSDKIFVSACAEKIELNICRRYQGAITLLWLIELDLAPRGAELAKKDEMCFLEKKWIQVDPNEGLVCLYKSLKNLAGCSNKNCL